MSSPAPEPAVREHRFRAPPPTPIKTAMGRRSAALDDGVLADYLESSLRVPCLSLPESYFPERSPLRAPAEVDMEVLMRGDKEAARRVIEAAAEVGAIRVLDGDGESAVAKAAEAAIEVGKGVFVSSEESRIELRRWFGRRDGVAEEFYWYRLRSVESVRILQRNWPMDYPILCEKMEEVAVTLEKIADCIAKILSKHVKNQTASKRIGKVQSILCLRKYDSYHNRDNISELSDFKSLHSHALSLHVCSEDREFCIRRPEGSSFFRLSAGSVLVTIGKPLQEWCNGEIKSAAGEIVFEPSYNPVPSFALEFMCSPPALSRELDHETPSISILDQLLILLALVILYNMWTMLF